MKLTLEYVEHVSAVDHNAQEHAGRRRRWWRPPVLERVIGAVRPYRGCDRTVVLRDLAPVLDTGYPDGGRWLARRLGDVDRGAASCQLIRDRDRLIAITIETPKGAGRRKLSTIWVADHARGRGLGARMLDRRRLDWLDTGIEHVWVTTGGVSVHSVCGLVVRRGFTPVAVEIDRYGEARDEHVFSWSPDRDSLSKTTGTGLLLPKSLVTPASVVPYS